MGIVALESSIDVVRAAEKRILNIFSNNVPVYFSFSGGKDSLCLADIILKLIQKGKISPKLLTVIFIDEEAIYPCVEKLVLKWRKRFLMVGAKFEWWCIECRHYNCFNGLENDESFICWDRNKKDVWVRQMPPFAITEHPLLQKRLDTYQDFFARYLRTGMNIIGTRAAESLQRRHNFARMKNNGMNAKYQTFPIYDWKNNDVWLYLKNNNIEIPDVYMYLWQSGIGKGMLRISQFFSIDTARCLVKMNEYYPDLMERVMRREPNAYLAALYWDSEMFGRSTAKRKRLVKDEKKDYKKLLEELLSNLSKNFKTKHSLYVAKRYKTLYMKFYFGFDEKSYRRMYEALIAGDPKLRTYRALSVVVASAILKNGKKDSEKYGY